MKSDQPGSLSAHYATKDELQAVRADVHSLQSDIQLIFAELRTFRAEMLVQFQLVRTELETQKKELQGQMYEHAREFERSMHAQTCKMIGLVLTVNIATVTAVYYIAN